MSISKIEMQDTNGNALYPHTSGDLVNYDTNKTVNQKIDEAITNLTNLKSNLATAVNNKTGSSLNSSSTITDITSKINAIVTLSSGTSDATATAGQILSGSTAYIKGSKVTGTMTNQGAVTSSLNCGSSYTIPAGYHNGSGKVTGNSLASQTNATAVAGQILSGQTAYVNGNKITGTMPNKGSYTDVTSWTPYNSKMFFRFPAGYYSGGSYTNDTQGGAECAIPMATITRDLGITGDKIVSGNNILGVNGTAQPGLSGMQVLETVHFNSSDSFTYTFNNDILSTFKYRVIATYGDSFRILTTAMIYRSSGSYMDLSYGLTESGSSTKYCSFTGSSYNYTPSDGYIHFKLSMNNDGLTKITDTNITFYLVRQN